ncbi:protein serine/threonine kinase, putative [Entamoeba invadens IP1]|uniref:Protein serine/threonine kinase, putative n=1 Tax=Entamoeba invadens IP1 TaxID=370355 RepID=A0A0A1U7M4_ENTIV|nr:protein serine/threonine kinase, putative [Entamoeba invadens IP1]ELP87985.1 protein serine/threonine kinase, putative [Entamoeba invadens IP1]|eukprot:XP_004254756.1 protein serine/threonine kinase, putative [Entamoeba invadens IP1]
MFVCMIIFSMSLFQAVSVDCVPGTYMSSTQLGECPQCEPGSISTTINATTCTPCAAGSIPNTSSSSCDLCPKGSSSKYGSTECTLCPMGSHASTEGSLCEQCWYGEYSNKVGQAECNLCPLGTYQNFRGTTQCKECYYGRYADTTGSDLCTDCAKGYFASDIGTVRCSACPAGTYASSTGSRECQPCSPNSYSLEGSSNCTSCTNIACNLCETTTGRCTSCNPGYSFSVNSICVICSAGYFSTGGTSYCSSCQNGFYALVGSAECKSCNTTCKMCDKKTGLCISCDPGYSYYDGVCTLCSTGSYSESGTVCYLCPNGFYTSKTGSSICSQCDGSCKTCDRIDGHCTSCYVGMITQNGICVSCGVGYISYNNYCYGCSTGTYSSNENSDTCYNCDPGYYTDSVASSECKQCSSTCRTCDPTTGSCTNCITNYFIQNGNCVTCEAGYKINTRKNKCDICPAGYYSQAMATKCKDCDSMTWSTEGSATCTPCSTNCSSCSKSNGHCTSCITGYGFAKDNYRCEQCQAGNYAYYSNCKICDDLKYQNLNGQTTCKSCAEGCSSCNKTTGVCINCKAGYGYSNGECTPCGVQQYSTGGTSQCMECPSGCTNCIKESGVCSECENGMKKDSGVCISCSSNGNCSSCTSTVFESNRKCAICNNGYYLDNNMCSLCNSISSECLVCSQTSKECTLCKNEYISTETSCVLCEPGEVKTGTKSCTKCYEKIQNCETCDYNGGIQICTLCYAPYVLSNDKQSCIDSNTNSTHYDEDKHNAITNMNNCVIQIGDICYLCNEKNSVLNNNKCINIIGKCLEVSIKTCDMCLNGVITSNGNCNLNGCGYQMNTNVTSCLQCANQYYGDSCESRFEGCALSKNGICVETKIGYYISGLLTQSCGNSDICLLSTNNSELYHIKCKNSYILSSTGECILPTECNKMSTNECIKCNEKYHMEDGNCVKNDEDCSIENGNICVLCSSGMTTGGKCKDIKEINCKVFNETCKTCNDGYYKNLDSCDLIEEKYPNCKQISLVTSKCVECEEGYFQSTGSCVEITQPTLTEENVTTFKSNVEENCETKTTKGCTRCNEGFYLENGTCYACQYPCTQCSTQTYCTACDEYSYDKNGQCFEINDLLKVCQVMMSTYSGCVICKDGYLRSSDGKSCDKCDESCRTCGNDGTCFECSEGYYRTSFNSTKLCNNYSELQGCTNKTSSGCASCEDGLYLSHDTCHLCNEYCETCSSLSECLSCITDYVLLNGECMHFSNIVNCISSSEGRCSACANDLRLNADGTLCEKVTNYGVIVGVPISIIVVIIVIIIMIIILVLVLHQLKIESDKMQNVCIFQMKRSNIAMKILSGDVLTNKSELTFSENGELNKIDTESRELLCVGNKGKGSLKVQITIADNCDKYTIRTTPQLITLKSGEACEFEVFIVPLCTSHLTDNIMIITLDIASGNKTTSKFPISISTENSTKLDYDELIDERQIGEGSFGIVYKGKYRGNDVAIKKMKEANSQKGKSLDEFEKEVNMLDKFRSDYIVHFYGAVFIPTKICMVTEFAKYGSLQDLMREQKDNTYSNQLKQKICLDTAKGIKYLHSNDILHRDIKPDNILIFSLELSVSVNAKLTDFGSSRNVNMLMTNMTFTKGIGTPVYMAPEILNQEKYKKPADMYSLAITMYEIFTWNEAYPKDHFKFPWKIAEFVSNGYRPKVNLVIPLAIFNVIDGCWAQNPAERTSIDDVIIKLQ